VLVVLLFSMDVLGLSTGAGGQTIQENARKPLLSSLLPASRSIEFHKINGRRLLGTTLLKGDERRHVLLNRRDMEETRLGGMIVKWQNGTERQIAHRQIDI
jgi:hypothetical protein